MIEMNIFKIEYFWYEGEHFEVLIGKKVNIEEFEKDLIEAKNFAESLKGKEIKEEYLGKGYSVECLPEFYRQIIWFLTNKKGYVDCEYNEDVSYIVDDNFKKEISITRSEKKIENKDLN